MSSAPTGERLDWLGGLTRALLAVAALLAGVWLYARWQSPIAFFGTPYPNRPAAADFRAVDHTGRDFRFASTRGQAVALFFGFTHCPDICPLSLQYLRKVRESLPQAQRERFRVVFVTLDPQRDTAAQLREYVGFLGGDITALRVPRPALPEVARSYGVSYARADARGGAYYLNHTTATYLIDPQGQLRVVWDYTQLPQLERVAADVRQVLQP